MDFCVHCNAGNKNSYFYVVIFTFAVKPQIKNFFKCLAEDNFPEKHPQDPRVPVPVRVPLRFLRNHKNNCDIKVLYEKGVE